MRRILCTDHKGLGRNELRPYASDHGVTCAEWDESLRKGRHDGCWMVVVPTYGVRRGVWCSSGWMVFVRCSRAIYRA